MASEMERTRQRSLKAKQRADWQAVVVLLEKYCKALPDDKAAALDLGDALMRLERFDDACRFYAKLLETLPRDPLVASNLGGALLRCGKIEEAKTLLEYSLELNPKNIYARINLGGVYQTLRDYQGALKNSLEAVSIDPTHPLAFNNLGSAFSDLAKFEEARHAYETAVMLDPSSVDALINLATTDVKLGDPTTALELFERVLQMLPPEAEQRAEAVRFYASFEYLKLGDLERGWNYYDGGFSPLVPQNGRRTPVRKFKVPEWRGESLQNKRLLVWREQGLGDEILFGTCLPDLLSLKSCQVIVEADHRMTSIWSRTFPEFEVRAQSFDSYGRSTFDDFHLHVPIGGLPRLFRSSIASFRGSPSRHLVADPERIATARCWLACQAVSKPTVGVCWRSSLIDPNRSLDYTNLIDWASLLLSDKFEIVSLQYDQCEAELQAAEKKFNRRILRPPFDQRNELEQVLGLMKNLDFVISAHTAVLHLAAYSGSKAVSVDVTDRFDWPFLGQKYLPWYRTTTSLQWTKLSSAAPGALEKLLFSMNL